MLLKKKYPQRLKQRAKMKFEIGLDGRVAERPVRYTKLKKDQIRNIPGRMAVSHRTPTRNSVPANIPAKKGYPTRQLFSTMT